MVIPWIVGGAGLVLVARWGWQWLKRRSRDAEMERRIRNRLDLHRHIGDNE